MNSLLFENLQLLKESKLNRKIMKEATNSEGMKVIAKTYLPMKYGKIEMSLVLLEILELVLPKWVGVQ